MASFDIDGCWQGEYVFDHHESFPERPPPIRFTLTARGGWFGKFQGVIQDDPEHGVTEPATVEGQLQSFVITFTKRYRALFLFYCDRSVSLADYLETALGLPLDHEVPGIPIDYEGEYNSADESMSGTWHMGPKQRNFRSNGKLLGMTFPARSGRWTVRRGPN